MTRLYFSWVGAAVQVYKYLIYAGQVVVGRRLIGHKAMAEEGERILGMEISITIAQVIFLVRLNY